MTNSFYLITHIDSVIGETAVFQCFLSVAVGDVCHIKKEAQVLPEPPYASINSIASMYCD